MASDLGFIGFRVDRVGLTAYGAAFMQFRGQTVRVAG